MIGKKPNPAKKRPNPAKSGQKPRKPRVKKTKIPVNTFPVPATVSSLDLSSPIKYVVSVAWENGFYVTYVLAELIIERMTKYDKNLDILKLTSKQVWNEVRNYCVF